MAADTLFNFHCIVLRYFIVLGVLYVS